VGKEVVYKDRKYIVNKLNNESINQIDIAFFAAGSEVSSKWCPLFIANGSIVIDNSSFYRMNDDCSLVVPEVNFESIYINNVISNPNCSTIQSVICLNQLKKYKIKRIIYTTFQAVSGSGYKGILDLEYNTQNYYPYKIKETCIPQVDSFLNNYYTKEEMKMIYETRKILGLGNVVINSTCVRVPVLNSHGVSVVVDFEENIDMDELILTLNTQDGLVILDDIKEGIYPTSNASNGNDKVYIGRIRKDIYNSKTLMFYCVADNIRRGAAFNAVMIAKKIIEKGIATKN
jgi:aspartate-semialdehyde dehydrogenase